MPPVSPMLAKSVPAIPPDASYEPKWDGFRSICFRDGDDVEFGSRNERPTDPLLPRTGRRGDRRAARALRDRRRDRHRSEITVWTSRHCSCGCTRPRRGSACSPSRRPPSFIAFDLLALGDDDYTGRPFTERRAALVEARSAGVRAARFHVTPATTDLATAQRWFDEFEGAGLDGVVAKPLTGTYQPDKRVMFKIKHERTADCVVAGYRVHKSGDDAIGSLMLGLYRDDGTLASVGVIGAFPMAERRAAVHRIAAAGNHFRRAPVELGRAHGRADARHADAGSRWNAGKDLSFVPLRPERVVEVRYDHMEGERFRHTAQFNRWRPDRDPRSCTYDQLEHPGHLQPRDIVPGLG